MEQTIDPFDNNWNEVRLTPVHRFQAVTYRDVYNRSSSWTLPEEWAVVVRYEHLETGQVMEKSYHNRMEADAAMEKYFLEGWGHTYYDEGVMIGSLVTDGNDDD